MTVAGQSPTFLTKAVISRYNLDPAYPFRNNVLVHELLYGNAPAGIPTLCQPPRGELLRRLREAAGLSVKSLAERLLTVPKVIEELEAGVRDWGEGSLPQEQGYEAGLRRLFGAIAAWSGIEVPGGLS